MSRPNGPLGQAGGALPPYLRPGEAQQYAQPAQAPRNGQPQYANPVQSNGHGFAPPQPAYPNQHAAMPEQGYYAPPQASAQPSYQPVFDRYAPAPEPQHGHDPRLQPSYAPAQPQYAPNQLPLSAHDPLGAAQRGSAYEQWQHSQPQAPAAPRGYDFSNYMPPAAPASDYGPGAQARQAPYVPLPLNEAQWPGAGGFDRQAELGDDLSGYRGQQIATADRSGYPAEDLGQLQPADDQNYDQDDLPDYEDDEPSKGRRGLIMVSALVGAIALGGGLAYAYKTFIKPPSGTQVAKVSAPKGPSKMQPADPGGKQFPNQDSKLQNRLNDGSPPPAAQPPQPSIVQAEAEGGVRRVPTVQIGRDGSMSAPAPAAPSTPIPGMFVTASGPPPTPVVQSNVAAASTATPPVVVQPQPRAAVAQPTPRQPVAAPEPVEPVAAAPVQKRVVAPKKPALPRDDLAAGSQAAGTKVASAAGATVPAKTGSGFVAVLASKASRADAQKANGDLEQRFDVLKGKIFDVQEADLTAQGKGVVYRSVVGPPGSRAFASGTCDQLKTVGYTSCWITNY